MAWPPEDGTPYVPSNGSEGSDFEAMWCAHCLNRAGEGEWEDEFGDIVEGRCSILDEAFYCQQPREWTWRDKRPHCSAFREDPSNRARCLKTMEMF